MFTVKQIENLKPKETRYDLREKNRSGLAVRVSPNGSKSFILFYDFDGRRRRMTLGNYPDISLADARKKATDAHELIDRGIDPLVEGKVEKQANVDAITFKDLVAEFTTRHNTIKPQTRANYLQLLTKDALPVWGNRKVRNITKRDVTILMEGILDRGSPGTAIVLFRTLTVLFNFAVRRDILEVSPCVNLRTPAPIRAKNRFLEDKEITTLLRSLDSDTRISPAVKKAMRLVLLTAQRPGEVCGMRHSEIDSRWWTIPPERSKNGRANRVFLSEPAMELITSMPKDDDYIFPSPKGNAPLGTTSMVQALGRHKFFGLKPFTAHDLRRTAATGMAALGFASIVPKILNHVDRSVTGIYQRYDFDREKQIALEAWGRKLKNLATGETAKVLHMRR